MLARASPDLSACILEAGVVGIHGAFAGKRD